MISITYPILQYVTIKTYNNTTTYGVVFYGDVSFTPLPPSRGD